MMGVTHIAVGVSFGVFVATTTDYSPAPLEWFLLIIGSLAPDIDSGNALISRPGKLFERFLPRIVTAILDSIGLVLSKLCHFVFGHRNAIHWPILAFIFIGAGYLAEHTPLIWFGCGYLMHIVADSATKGGAPLFGPFYRKDISWLPIRTGSWTERLLATVLWAYIAYAGYTLLPSHTQVWLERYGRLVTGEH